MSRRERDDLPESRPSMDPPVTLNPLATLIRATEHEWINPRQIVRVTERPAGLLVWMSDAREVIVRPPFADNVRALMLR